MLYMKVTKRVNSKSSHHEEEFIFYFFNVKSIWDDGCLLNLLWYSFHDVCKSDHYGVQLIQWCLPTISQ